MTTLPTGLADALLTRVIITEPPDLPHIARELSGGTYHQRDHLDALSGLLTAAVADAAAGQSRRIVVSMPPGQGKSVTCSVALPLYMLAQYPDWNIGITSAEASLATKFSRDARRHAPTFRITLAPDSAAVTEWETIDGGGMIARGVGGALTGRRIKALIIDDPVKDARAAHSQVERDALWDWWQSVAKTRLAPSSLALLAMTRWHEDDLAARLLKQGWEEFRLPALAEDGDPIGRAPGEPMLTPQADETPEQALTRWAQVREEVGSYVWAGLYQQRPAPAGGSVFNPDWLLPVDAPLDLETGSWVTSWDLSYGSKGDYTVGTVWQCLPDRYILHDVIRGRWEFTEQLAAIRRTATRYPQCSHHLVEAAANGAAVVDTLKRETTGVYPVKPLGGKVERWQAITPLMEAGKVFHVDGAWLPDLIAEMAVAPNGAHDDQLDSLAQALNWLRVRKVGPPRVAKVTNRTLPGW